jgi:hypothetical protein
MRRDGAAAPATVAATAQVPAPVWHWRDGQADSRHPAYEVNVSTDVSAVLAALPAVEVDPSLDETAEANSDLRVRFYPAGAPGLLGLLEVLDHDELVEVFVGTKEGCWRAFHLWLLDYCD